MTTPVRVVVGVGSREVRASLFVALDSIDGLKVVGSATSAAEAVTLCRTMQPDVAIVADGLSDWNLIDLLDAIVVPMWAGIVLVVSSDNTTDGLSAYENVQLVQGIDEIASLIDFERQ